MDSNFFAGPSYMTGGYLPIYAGGRRHRGGGILGSMRSGFAPVKRSFISGASAIRKRFVPIKSTSVIKAQNKRKRFVPAKRLVTSSRPIKRPARNNSSSIGKRLVSGVKSLARNKTLRRMGKKALVKGAEIGAQVAVDALTGRHIGESITTRSKEAALETLTGQRATSIKRPSIHLRRKLKQRKRAAPFSIDKSQPPGKRLRKARSRARLNRRQLF